MSLLKNKGFTLVELMIVVAIIGVLAAIAIPKFAMMLEKSREGATKDNLGSIRAAASIYYGGNQGIWPTTLNSTSTFNFSTYIQFIPPVQVTGVFSHGGTDPTGSNVSNTHYEGAPTSANSGWLYDSTQGYIYVNSTLRDSQNVPYSYYGYQ